MIFVWFKYPNTIKSNLPAPISKILGTINTNQNDDQGNIINNAKDSLEQTSQTVVNNAKDTAYQEAKSALDNVFGKQSSTTNQTVNVSILGESTETPPQSDLYNIDLSQATNLKVNLQKNTNYYLKFQNTPANYCLYINDNKYPIGEDKTVKIIFTSSGTYSIKTNTCNLADKILGEFTVK